MISVNRICRDSLHGYSDASERAMPSTNHSSTGASECCVGMDQWRRFSLKKTFVANRVAEITTHLPAIDWSYIASKQNSADLKSHGAFAEHIQNNALWWFGPSWDTEGGFILSAAPELTNNDQQHITGEQRATIITLVSHYENSVLNKMMARYYPDLTVLLRVTARTLRFRHRESRRTSRLLPSELDRAKSIYIRYVQQQQFRQAAFISLNRS